MTYDFEVSDEIAAPASLIFDTWMSSAGHSAMTGGTAEIDPAIGRRFEAWDGYITGTTIALEPGRRIVQSWRTTEFETDDVDSQIEVLLEPLGQGTRITIRHTGVPSGQLAYEQNGWRQNYFEPMQEYFSRQ